MKNSSGIILPLNPWLFLIVLTGLSMVMRFFSFFPSVIDHDESTYIVIADALRQGDIYLRDVIDTKPIGIFTLFALFQTLFGKSILIIRVLTALWIALTGWMLFLIHRRLIDDTSTNSHNPGPVASGMIYIFITSVYTVFGVSPNTEHFFVLFTVLALYLLVSKKGFGWMFLAGLLLGIGFMIKYVVLFDAIALGIFYLWQQVVAGKKWLYWFLRCALMGIGFLVPFTIVWLYYVQVGMGESFFFYSFQVSGEYFIKPPWYKYILYVLDGLARFLPVTIWFIYCSCHWRTVGPKLPFLAWGWGALVLFIILLPGKLFPHYFIQFMLPLSLLAGSFFDTRLTPGRALSWMRKPDIGYSLMIIILITNFAFQKIDYYDKPDYPREVAAYLNTKLKPGDIIYTANASQIIYHLTGTESPTPYVHPSLIWTKANNEALDINQQTEWNKILKQNPRFIITKKQLPSGNPMIPALLNLYRVVKTFGKEVKVYERK